VVSCLVRDVAQKPCAPSPRYFCLDVGQSGPFIIESIKGVLFALRQCTMVLVRSGRLLGVASWCVWSCSLLCIVSAVLAFLLYD
jgi:hypothetical protein